MQDARNLPTDGLTEREKWKADQDHREQELALKKLELDLRATESRRARYTNPLVLAIAGGTLTLFINSITTFTTSYLQRQIETQKSEAQLILEVVKTADPSKAATNLLFLTSANLIKDREVREGIKEYVKNTPVEKGISLPAPTSSNSTFERQSSATVTCTIRDSTDIAAAKAALEADPQHIRTSWVRQSDTEAAGTTEVFAPQGVIGKVLLEFALKVEGTNIQLRVSARIPDNSLFSISMISNSFVAPALRNAMQTTFAKVGKGAICR